MGPSPTGVDEGAGLLLVGFNSIMVLPLPAHSHAILGANWLLLVSGKTCDFADTEIDRVLLLTWAFLDARHPEDSSAPTPCTPRHSPLLEQAFSECMTDLYVG